MNFLSHPYVAFKVTGRISPDLVAGSLLNDLAFFVPQPAFSFEEIHEGGEELLGYLKTHGFPPDLAIGVLTHSVKYGADLFSRKLEKEYEGYREELTKKIMRVSPNISQEIATKARFHNYLWWGVDVQILEHYPTFAKKVRNCLRLVDLEKINKILADCFRKDPSHVKKNLNFFYGPLEKNNLQTVGDLVKIWQAAASGLPEKDEVDYTKALKLFEECGLIVEDRWQTVLEEVISTLRTNLCNYLLAKPF